MRLRNIITIYAWCFCLLLLLLLLNGREKDRFIMKIYPVYLEINIKNLEKNQCGNLSTLKFDATMHKIVDCLRWQRMWKPPRSIKYLDTQVHKGSCQHNVIGVRHNFSGAGILLTFALCQCNVMTLLYNLTGTEPGVGFNTKLDLWSYGLTKGPNQRDRMLGDACRISDRWNNITTDLTH